MPEEEKNELLVIEKAFSAIAEATTVLQVKEVHNKTKAMAEYVRATKQGLDIQNMVAEIKLRAERKAGELLAEMPKHTGGRPADESDDDNVLGAETLEELGVTPRQSSDWQLIALVPDDTFEDFVAKVKDEAKELTTAEALRIAKKIKRALDAELAGAQRPGMDDSQHTSSVGDEDETEDIEDGADEGEGEDDAEDDTEEDDSDAAPLGPELTAPLLEPSTEFGSCPYCSMHVLVATAADGSSKQTPATPPGLGKMFLRAVSKLAKNEIEWIDEADEKVELILDQCLQEFLD